MVNASGVTRPRSQESLTDVDPTSTDHAPARALPRPYRHDLDGLRAFAIGLVVVYHVWVGRVSGGVDVFLLLSAYFLTDSLLRRAENGRLGLGAFYARRFWRLVPAAAVTIGITLLVVWQVFPQSLWTDAWSQGIASLFYVENWQLALNSVDYYARDANELTPFLHFWSLSIQGQVFVLWPLLLAVVWGIARLAKASIRRVALIVFGGVFLASLAYSVVSTELNQSFAYFDTGARLWEFALGSLIALVPFSLRLPRWVAEIVGWAALIALLACGLVLDVASGFPGYLALWPALCAVGLILAGRSGTSFSRLLSAGPLRWLGRIAYALYLVHWPVLITWMVLSGESRPDFVTGAAIIAVSIGIAVLLHYTIERPLGSWTWVAARPWRSWSAVAVAAALVVTPVALWQADTQRHEAVLLAEAAEAAAAAEEAKEFQPESLVPTGAMLDSEWVGLDQACTGADAPTQPLARALCQETIVADSQGRAVFVGDSHAEQWMGGFLPLLDEQPLTPTALLRGGCTFAPDGAPAEAKADADAEALADIAQCNAWQQETMEYLLELAPPAVIMMASKATPDTAGESIVDGITTTARRLADAGSEVIMVRDNPRFSENMYRCLESNLDDPTRCARSASEVLAAENPAADLDEIRGVHVLDMTEHLCPEGICSPVVGSTAVYLDDNHLTWTFARTLSPHIDAALAQSGFRW